MRPDDPIDTPETSDSEMEIEEYLEQGTETGEGEIEPGETEGAEGEGAEVDWEARYKALQSEYTTTAQERSELRRYVGDLVSKAQQGNGATTEPDVNKMAEQLARDKGAGYAIDHIAQLRAQEMVAPIAQKLQQLEVQSANPDYAALKPRIDKILSDASSGTENIDTIIARLARAEAAIDKASKTGTVPRKPDNPSRGAMTGARGRSTAAEGLDPDKASDLDIQREIARTLKGPALSEFLARHPGLRGKAKE